MSIEWESILPKKIQFTSGDLVTQEMRTAALLRNETIDDCLSALKDAENRGEIKEGDNYAIRRKDAETHQGKNEHF